MVYRSAFLGLLIALVVAAAILFPEGNRRLADRLDAFVRRMTETVREEEPEEFAEKDVPPARFPVASEEEEEEKKERAMGRKPLGPRRELVRITKLPQEREVAPGSVLRFSLSVENVSDAPLRKLMMEERFDDDVLIVEDAGEGAVAPNAIVWAIPDLGAGEQWNAVYTMAIAEDIPRGIIETTAFVSGAALEGTASAPRLATSVLTLVPLPKTGVELPLWARLWAAALP